jgi:hypothetical protein
MMEESGLGLSWEVDRREDAVIDELGIAEWGFGGSSVARAVSTTFMISPLPRGPSDRSDSGFLNDFVDRVARVEGACVGRTGGTLKFGMEWPCCLVFFGDGTFIGTLNPFVDSAGRAARLFLDDL